MKVGILTFHEGLNHGAYLQAYSTIQMIRQLGHDPVVINYKNREHWLIEDVRPWFKYRRPVRFLDRIQKERVFIKEHQQFPLTDYTHNPDHVRKWNFDAVVFGSDVIWDISKYGYDSLYFGDLKTDRRIAYAASCGKTDAYAGSSKDVTIKLKEFDHISVRDVNTQHLVKELTGHDPEIVSDPVFLPEPLSVLCDAGDDPRIPKEPFVLIYGSSYSAEDGQVIRDYARKKNLKVISLGNRNFWADQSILSVGPLSILNWFKASDSVFSSTFHGCIFSIRCEKNFVVRIHPAIRNKVNSLLNLLGLESRGADQLMGLKQIMLETINYQSVNVIIDLERGRSLKFLKSALC